jgi:hypothetical protein
MIAPTQTIWGHDEMMEISRGFYLETLMVESFLSTWDGTIHRVELRALFWNCALHFGFVTLWKEMDVLQ